MYFNENSNKPGVQQTTSLKAILTQLLLTTLNEGKLKFYSRRLMLELSHSKTNDLTTALSIVLYVYNKEYKNKKYISYYKNCVDFVKDFRYGFNS